MPRIGEQGDVLRALGAFLDEEQKTNVMIEVHDSFLTVASSQAKDQSGRRYYQDHDLGLLRARAQSMRSGQAGNSVPGSLSEWLRTLGQDLDEAEIEMTAISQEDDGFRVSGLWDGKYHTQHAFWYEIEEASARHRANRGSGGGHAPEELDPFLGISVGVPIITGDGESVGKVRELRRRWLKVAPGPFRRNYWLPANCVGSARLGQAIRLTIRKSEIEAYKSSTPVSRDAKRPIAPGADAWY